jgi:hypothetical protein
MVMSMPAEITMARTVVAAGTVARRPPRNPPETTHNRTCPPSLGNTTRKSSANQQRSDADIIGLLRS